MFIKGRVFNGLDAHEMVEVNERVVPTPYKSPVKLAKPKREKVDDGRKRGAIKAYDHSKGFGFIRSGKEEFFFHIGRSPEFDPMLFTPREPVLFEIDADRNGRPVAVNVRFA